MECGSIRTEKMSRDGYTPSQTTRQRHCSASWRARQETRITAIQTPDAPFLYWETVTTVGVWTLKSPYPSTMCLGIGGNGSRHIGATRNTNRTAAVLGARWTTQRWCLIGISGYKLIRRVKAGGSLRRNNSIGTCTAQVLRKYARSSGGTYLQITGGNRFSVLRLKACIWATSKQNTGKSDSCVSCSTGKERACENKAMQVAARTNPLWDYLDRWSLQGGEEQCQQNTISPSLASSSDCIIG